MANFLASVGRARPTRNVLDVIQGGIQLDQNERRNQLTAAEMAMSAEQLEQTKRQGEYQEQMRAEGETPLAIETLASGFEGGDQGPMFKMVYDMADKAGMVDKTAGGMGTIKKRQLPEIGQMMSEPNFVSKLSRTRIDYWRGQHGQIKAALAEKPTDQKLLEAFQQANDGLNQALGHDASLQTEMKRQAAEAKETPSEKRAAELRDKKEYARYAQSIKPAKIEGITISDIEGRLLDEVVNAGRPLSDLTKQERRVYENFFKKGTTASKQKPEFYEESVSNGFTAIKDGGDPATVYNTLAQNFPGEAKELKAILFYPQTFPEDVKSDLVAAVEEIQAGAKRNDVYTKLAAKYPKHSTELRRILITPTTDQTLQALIAILDQ